jgi:hypothetical protein
VQPSGTGSTSKRATAPGPGIPPPGAATGPRFAGSPAHGSDGLSRGCAGQDASRPSFIVRISCHRRTRRGEWPGPRGVVRFWLHDLRGYLGPFLSWWVQAVLLDASPPLYSRPERSEDSSAPAQRLSQTGNGGLAVRQTMEGHVSCRGYKRSPGDSRRWASRARSSAPEAP